MIFTHKGSLCLCSHVFGGLQEYPKSGHKTVSFSSERVEDAGARNIALALPCCWPNGSFRK